jgi:hypothetical protein
MAHRAPRVHGVITWFRSRGNEPLTSAEFNARFQAENQELAGKLDAVIKAISDGKGSPPKSLTEALDTATSESGSITDLISADRLQDAFDAQATNLEQLAQFEEFMTADQLTTLEGIASRIADGTRALQQAGMTDLGAVVAEQAPQLQSVNTDLAGLMEDLGGAVDADTQAAIQSNAELAAQVSSEMEELPEEAKTAASEDPEVEPIESL